MAQQADNAFTEEEYEEYVKAVTPKHNFFLQVLRAFLMGGTICAIGQGIKNFFSEWCHMEETQAGNYTTLVLILAAVLLTGFGLYARMAKWGGAGTLVPICGFANSIASTAIEYKAEGHVFGIGSKIFLIAGPVILYGIFSSAVLGILYFFLI